MEEVFRALADPHRRTLLDALRDRDGQALGELDALLPGMTRFGVMKHLRVLADAGLLSTRRDGRRKLHFLNPVPIQLLADRWISRYAKPWTTGLADLKHTLEASAPMSSLKHVYEVFIRTTPEKLWAALVEPAITERYFHATRVASDWQPGSPLTYTNPDGSIAIDGHVVEADPPRRLVHDDFDGETKTYKGVERGWDPILSSLKTLLETGQPLEIAWPTPSEAEEAVEVAAM